MKSLTRVVILIIFQVFTGTFLFGQDKKKTSEIMCGTAVTYQTDSSVYKINSKLQMPLSNKISFVHIYYNESVGCLIDRYYKFEIVSNGTSGYFINSNSRSIQEVYFKPIDSLFLYNFLKVFNDLNLVDTSYKSFLHSQNETDGINNSSGYYGIKGSMQFDVRFRSGEVYKYEIGIWELLSFCNDFHHYLQEKTVPDESLTAMDYWISQKIQLEFDSDFCKMFMHMNQGRMFHLPLRPAFIKVDGFSKDLPVK